MHDVPKPQKEFLFMQEVGNIQDQEMYGTFNMGAGFAIMVDKENADAVIEQAYAQGFLAWDAGAVEEGPKQVIIEPKGIVFSADTLAIR